MLRSGKRQKYTLRTAGCVLACFSCYSILVNYFVRSSRQDQIYDCWKGRKQLAYSISAWKECFARLPNQTRRAHTRLTFVGDSRLRQLHHGIYRRLATNPHIPAERHQDFSYFIPELRFGAEFIWSEHLSHPHVQEGLVNLTQRTTSDRSNIIFFNDGAWTMMYCADRYRLRFPDIPGIKTRQPTTDDIARCFVYYKQSVSSILKFITNLSSPSRLIWIPQNPIWLAPRTKRYSEFISTDTSRKMNLLARELFKHSKVEMWQSYYDIFSADLSDSYDGLHLGNKTLQLAIDIIFQSLCGTGDNFQFFKDCNPK